MSTATTSALAQRVGALRAVDPVSYLAGIRLGFGVASMAAPRVTARLFGVDTGAQPAVPFALRLFGARNLLLGAALLHLERVSDRRAFLAANLLVDVSDALSAVAAGRRGELSLTTTVLAIMPPSVEIGLGLSAITRRPHD